MLICAHVGSDREQQVVFAKTQLAQLPLPVAGKVLEALQRADERGIAPGHEPNDAPGQLRREHPLAAERLQREREPPRRPAPAQEDAPARREGLAHGGGQRRDAVRVARELPQGEPVHVLERGHGPRQVVLRQLGEVARERVGLLGHELAQAELIRHRQKFLRIRRRFHTSIKLNTPVSVKQANTTCPRSHAKRHEARVGRVGILISHGGTEARRPAMLLSGPEKVVADVPLFFYPQITQMHTDFFCVKTSAFHPRSSAAK